MNWKQVATSEILKVHYGKALKQADRKKSGIYPVFGSNGQVGNHDKQLFGYPSLVIGRKGSVGEITYAPKGGWVIDTAFYTEILDSSKLDLRFLFYALKFVNLGKHMITTSIPGINRDSIYQTKIPSYIRKRYSQMKSLGGIVVH